VIAKGCGYVLPDNSLALFGYMEKGGNYFAQSYTGVIARVHKRWAFDAEFFSKPLYGSVTAGDAVPITSYSFVTVRQRALDSDRGHSGIVMSWVTSK